MKRGFSRNVMLQLGLLALVTLGVSPAAAQARDWIGSVEPFWELPTNWDPFGVPLTNETIRIGVGVPDARVELNSAVTVANLDMSGSALLEDDPFVQYPPNPGGSGSLVVQGATKLIDSSRLTVLVRTGSLEIAGLSSVVKGPGSALEVEGEATLTSGATLQLLDDFKLSQTGGTSLRNDGTVDVRRAATMEAAFGSLIDLDGPGENGRVTIGPMGAGQGQLTIDGALSDSFDGLMDLTSGIQAPTLTMLQPWEATPSSLINLNRATIAGATFTSSGWINVAASVMPSTIAANVVMPRGTISGAGSLVFEGTTTLTDEDLISVAVPVEFANVANIVGATVDGGSFTFSGATTITDATMTSDHFEFDGAATIGGASNIDVDSIGIGGAGMPSSLTIAAGDVGTRFLSNRGLEGNVLNLEGGILRLNGGGIGLISGDLRFSSPQSPVLRIQDGSELILQGSLNMGFGESSAGSTVVVGTDGVSPSTLNATSMVVGRGGHPLGDASGILLVNAGGLVNVNDINPSVAGGVVIGSDSYSLGQVIVTGVQDGLRSTLDVEGTIFVADGEPSFGSLEVTGGALVQAGGNILLARGAVAGFASTAVVSVGGDFEGFNAELIAAGNIRFFNGFGTLSINPGGRVEADQMDLGPNSTLNLNGGELKLNVLDVTSGGDANLSSGLFDVNTVEGDVDLTNVTVSPGDSPGIMTFNGNLTTAGTTFEIELGGTNAGTEFDRVEIAGTANIDGTLDVQLFDLGGVPFEPGEGDTFEIFSAAGGVTGEFVFDTLTAPSLPAGLMWDVDYGTHDILLQVLAAFAAADFNEDGDVDINDLNAMLSQGPIAPGVSVTPGVNEQFDLNSDGTINLDDRDEWLADAATENGFGSPYKLGDANLDGVVDGQDFILWNGSKFTSSLLWDTGEFNGDGVVDGQDFIDWNGNKFTSSDGVSAVPEPGTRILSLMAMLLLGAARMQR